MAEEHAVPTHAGLTHLDAEGHAYMVDVAAKAETQRVAVAGAFVSMQPETLAMILDAASKKGDVIAVARVAGIQGAKRASELIPLCHPISLTKVSVDIEPVTDGRTGLDITATAETVGRTGVEMEALTAAAVAGLTVYDMCKAVDRGMVVSDVQLLRKEGGRSGLWTRKEDV